MKGERVSFVSEAGRLFSISCKSLSSPPRPAVNNSLGIGMGSKATWWLRAYALDPQFASWTHIGWLCLLISRIEAINILSAMGF